MATIPYSSETIGEKGKPKIQIITWANVGQGDDGQPIELSELADRSVQYNGTWGSGGEMVLEGSNDATNYSTLKDPFGNDIDVSADGLVAITEAVRMARPRCLGGDGTTAVSFTLLVRRGY